MPGPPGRGGAPRLIALGSAGRLVWSLYALIPLLLVPAAVGMTVALRDAAPGAARSGAVFAVISAFSMMLGLSRWPSVQWEIALRYGAATPSERVTLDAMFAGLDSYLGNFLGEFVGELALNLFFLLTAYAMTRSARHPRWLGVGGIAASLIGFVAMFRNATSGVALVAEVNNLVLPIWLVILGVALIRDRAQA